LAKEISAQGHDVTLIVPENDFNYTEISKRYHFTIHKTLTGFFFNKNAKLKNSKINSTHLVKKGSALYYLMRLLFRYLYIGGYSFEYTFYVLKKIIQIQGKFDLIISIGLPISVHLGTGLALFFKRNLSKCAVADYGDPFSINAEFKVPKIHKFIEKRLLRFFSYITIPIPEAKKSFLNLKSESNVVIIPQGYDFSQFKISSYVRNEIPCFAYAGVFYEKTRNPKPFFEFLSGLDKPFLFTLYTDTSSFANMELINPFLEKLSEKILIKDLIPQKDCIFELSKYDFLINFENNTKRQSPSKLIDYCLTKRPVYSYNENFFNHEVFLDFLNGRYEMDSLKNFELSDYDIKLITKRFLSLS
jgi:hypothetical protein